MEDAYEAPTITDRGTLTDLTEIPDITEVIQKELGGSDGFTFMGLPIGNAS